MSTLSINAARGTQHATRSAFLLLALLFSGCAINQGGGLDGTAEGNTSKYEQRPTRMSTDQHQEDIIRQQPYKWETNPFSQK